MSRPDKRSTMTSNNTENPFTDVAATNAPLPEGKSPDPRGSSGSVATIALHDSGQVFKEGYEPRVSIKMPFPEGRARQDPREGSEGPQRQGLLAARLAQATCGVVVFLCFSKDLRDGYGESLSFCEFLVEGNEQRGSLRSQTLYSTSCLRRRCILDVISLSCLYQDGANALNTSSSASSAIVPSLSSSPSSSSSFKAADLPRWLGTSLVGEWHPTPFFPSPPDVSLSDASPAFRKFEHPPFLAHSESGSAHAPARARGAVGGRRAGGERDAEQPTTGGAGTNGEAE
ncbi:hypothetical protein BC830DRAFT_1135977 [Chytriomyces sp. MP71]|nr:hypothetical protein BC830DRAFT_1135977 [Chytriomyces sp. MP71]